MFLGDITSEIQSGVGTFFRELPGLIGALVLLVILWVVAGLLGKIVERVVNTIGGDRLTQRAGIDGFLQRAGVQNASAGGVLGFVVKWWIRLIALEGFLSALGIAAVTQTLNEITLYVPRIIAALFILLIGAFLAKLAGEAVRRIADGAGMSNDALMGTIAQATVLVLTFVAVLQQVGIAETLVNELLIFVLVTIAGSAILAFGLGGRDAAARLISSAVDRTQGTISSTGRVAPRGISGDQQPTGSSSATPYSTPRQ